MRASRRWTVLAVALFIATNALAGGIGLGQTVNEWQIPADAQARAIRALKALGPERGALKINFRVVEIIGASQAVMASRVEIMQTLKDLGAKETGTEIQIELSGDILFDFDKWDVRADAAKTLKKVASLIQAYKSPKVTILGHTDSKGDDSYNQKLSERRAESVMTWLVKNGGIEARILTTAGYGETKPVAPNTKPDGSDDPAGRQKNRRVEIIIKKQ